MATQFREISQSVVVGLLLVISFVTSAGCRRTGSESGASWGAGQLNGPEQARSERDFILSLQQALKAGDRNRILSFIRFPVRVGEGKTRADMDEDMFTRDYDKIWNPQTVKAVIDENPDQLEWPPGALSDNVGCGEVLFSKTSDGQFRITGFDISEYRIAGISLPDCYRARDFVRQLQAAVAGDHRQQIADMIKYPLHFHGRRKTLILHSATDTLRNYDLVFSGSLRQALAKQQVRNLMGQADGVAIEGGYIWINEPSENGEFKIVSIFAP
jgi:hypothetical protein